MYTIAELIERLSKSMQDHENTVIQRSDFANMTINHIHYLDAIRHYETPPTITQLANALNVTKLIATNAIDCLEADLYIRKVPSTEDSRVLHVCLTSKGLKISDLHDLIHQGYSSHFKKALSKTELNKLVELLNKVIQHLGL